MSKRDRLKIEAYEWTPFIGVRELPRAAACNKTYAEGAGLGDGGHHPELEQRAQSDSPHFRHRTRLRDADDDRGEHDWGNEHANELYETGRRAASLPRRARDPGNRTARRRRSLTGPVRKDREKR